MNYIYLLSVKFDSQQTYCGLYSFTRKRAAIEIARFYRDCLHCDFVTLRQDKQCVDGVCDIIGYIDF